MNTSVAPNLDRVIEDLPRSFPGPGGALAVVKDGIAIVRHAWGYAGRFGKPAACPNWLRMKG